MTFNFYSAIEAKISEVYDAIYNSWYTNSTQAVNAYDILFYQL